jgi:hypothetical protein
MKCVAKLEVPVLRPCVWSSPKDKGREEEARNVGKLSHCLSFLRHLFPLFFWEDKAFIALFSVYSSSEDIEFQINVF